MADNQLPNSTSNADSHVKRSDILAESGATLSDSIREIELYVGLLESEDFADFMKRVLGKINSLGFSDYTFARLHTLGDAEAPLGTAPQELLELYFKEGFAEHDLVLDYGLANNTTPIFQSTVAEHINSAPFVTETFLRNQEILRLNQNFGRLDYYVIPIQAHDGSDNILFSITSKDMNPVDFQNRIKQCAPLLQLLGKAIDYIGLCKFPDFFLRDNENRKILIHPRPLMLLNTLAKENLSLNQAAEKMCISIDTVNKHVAAAKKALGAKTIANAVYRAVKEGLIDYKN
jgi:predicted DNA-binding protein (UPF0251 family)